MPQIIYPIELCTISQQQYTQAIVFQIPRPGKIYPLVIKLKQLLEQNNLTYNALVHQ